MSAALSIDKSKDKFAKITKEREQSEARSSFDCNASISDYQINNDFNRY